MTQETIHWMGPDDPKPFPGWDLILHIPKECCEFGTWLPQTGFMTREGLMRPDVTHWAKAPKGPTA